MFPHPRTTNHRIIRKIKQWHLPGVERRTTRLDLFTWDDSAAAEKWRVHEARVLIRTYSIEVTKTSPEDALIHVPVEKGHRGEGYYTKASALVKSVSAFDRALGEAERGQTEDEEHWQRFHSARCIYQGVEK